MSTLLSVCATPKIGIVKMVILLKIGQVTRKYTERSKKNGLEYFKWCTNVATMLYFDLKPRNSAAGMIWANITPAQWPNCQNHEITNGVIERNQSYRTIRLEHGYVGESRFYSIRGSCHAHIKRVCGCYASLLKCMDHWRTTKNRKIAFFTKIRKLPK